MKKISLLACLALVMMCAAALADVAINEENFPDDVFRVYVAQFDTDGNGRFSTAETGNVTCIDVSGCESVSSLKGVEYFTALTQLYCDYNSLSSLDLSGNTKLEYLSCEYNPMRSLNVRRNSRLKTLNCGFTELASLDVSKNTALEVLSFHRIGIKSIDLSRNAALTSLNCGENNLSKLDVSKNTRLESLWCEDNRLASLDISRNTKLKCLNCTDNQLAKLDLDKKPLLSQLWCNGNQLKKLDIRKCKILNRLVKEISPGIEWGYGYGWWRTDDPGECLFADENVKIITDSGGKIKIASITLNKTKATLKRGRALQLKVKEILPADAANRKVRWATSDPKIATVSSKGKVEAKKKGTCIITCTATDGSGVKATCKITVQ